MQLYLRVIGRPASIVPPIGHLIIPVPEAGHLKPKVLYPREVAQVMSLLQLKLQVDDFHRSG